MNDREICEKIVKNGDCDKVTETCGECPLNGGCTGDDEHITAKQWLSSHPEPKDIETMVEEYDEKQENKLMTKREYLVNRLKEIYAHKAKFEKVTNEAIEKIHKEMTCNGGHVQEDGKYYIDEHRLEKSTALSFADLIKRMESPMEEK